MILRGWAQGDMSPVIEGGGREIYLLTVHTHMADFISTAAGGGGHMNRTSAP